MNEVLILIVEDDPLQRRLIKQNLEREGYVVMEAPTGRAAREIAGRYPVEIAVVDYKLNGETGVEVIRDLLRQNPLITPIVVTAFANVETAVEAMRQGAYDYIVKPIDFEKFLLVIERARERQGLRREVNSLRSSLEDKFSSKNLVLESPLMEEVGRLIAKAAGSEATVLISGETGTGKDVVAKTIHFSSKRKDGPYLAVNIPSLPETLIEGELFGAEKGAYTGATEKKIGKFEAASGGTLLLDEIGDLPVQAQVKLLRILQEKEFYRLGSSKALRSDVRIIAATNRDLEALMKDGRFRPDLFYRLNVVHIQVPPLRQRKEDIPALVDLFIKRYAPREKKKIDGITQEAMAALLRYSFPGNIRELENIIERAVVFADTAFITLADIPVFLKEKKEDEVAPEGLSLDDQVRRLEVREIKRAFIEAGGVKARAARALGITERVLGYKMKTFGLDA
ncbi:MAG: two-component system response regulator [Candidatus Aminicenantes bacterium RBG_16_63_16]|nr:MAG: two-component system response regulator [Candidatus Aminicenantes bacterium RBG_16_63_16]